MKKLLFVLALIFITQQVLSQDFPINEKTGKVSFENIIKVDDVSKSDLYLRANEWFAKTFNSANSVIQMQDKEAGKIIGKGNITAYGHYKNFESGIWKFTVSFTAKEGRFRYVISDIYHETGGYENVKGAGGDIKNEKPACGKWYLTKGQWNKIKARAYTQFQDIANDLEESMTITLSEDDDW
tara:strand:+ start:220 stop:768 length:549 start_codon:yes stop_codon:yes gene_type:complete